MLNEFNEVVELSDDTNIQDLFGNNNKNIELLEELLQVKIITRGESLSITGEEEPVQHTTAVLNELILTVKRGIHIDGRDIAQAVKNAKKRNTYLLSYLI